VKYAWTQGFHEAERIALAGANDQGDVVLQRSPKIIIEVKAGKSAQTASLGQISKWLDDTQRERNAAALCMASLWCSDKALVMRGLVIGNAGLSQMIMEYSLTSRHRSQRSWLRSVKCWTL